LFGSSLHLTISFSTYTLTAKKNLIVGSQFLLFDHALAMGLGLFCWFCWGFHLFGYYVFHSYAQLY